MRSKVILGLAIITVSALSSFNKSAIADDKFPAADFQPSVIYMDKEVVAQATRDDKYPASSFEPKVIYSDDSASSQSSAQEVVEPVDPKYPAAYFKPRVIFP